MNNKLFGFDFDGVIFPLDIVICEKLSDMFEKEIIKTDLISHRFKDCFDMSSEQIDETLDHILHPTILDNIEPMSGCIEFLNYLSIEKNQKIKIITARTNIKPIEDYMKKHLHRNVIIQVFHGKDKGPIAYTEKITHFVDDRFKHLREVASFGIMPIIFDQPWNKKVSSKSNLIEIFNRIYKWEDLYSCV